MGSIRKDAEQTAREATEPAPPLGHIDVLKIALPITLSNATVPLIGFVDTAVIGQLGQPQLMGAVAVGAIIFNILYWTFGFLRMGTTGLTAQALGAKENREIAGHLLRALLVATVGGVLLIALQWPIRESALWLTGGSPEVVKWATVYFDIRIWAAPAGLVNFALLGWFIGLGRAGIAFVLQLALNLANMALAVLLVLGIGMGVAGVGIAALVAEWCAALAGLWVALRLARRMGAHAPRTDAIDRRKLGRSLVINTDITIRSLGNFAAITFFTSQGAAAGDVTLAANALLVNIKNIMVYLLDGFAFAVEAFVGRAVGARNRPLFWRAVRLTTVWAAGFAILVGGMTWFAGEALIAFSAKSDAVRAAAGAFLVWAAVAPLIGVWCFQLDGIFIGATRTRDMRNMMLLSLVFFFAAFAVLGPAYGNHGLWGAMMVFYVARAVTLYARLGALDRAAFG
jgi:multidrug resistance protein, MATE family